MKKIICLISMLTLVGCSSIPVTFVTPPNQVEGRDYKVLGESEGSSVGVMLFGFIPINQNDRFMKAQEEAILRLGGDRLLNPQIQERWYWAYLFNGYIFKVKGTVVKDIKPSGTGS